MKVRFAYLTKKPDEVKKVQHWLNEYHMTVNRESTVNVDEQGLQEMKKQWPELTDYSLLLNLYMCVILIDFVRRFERASSKVIQQATMNPYVAIENENMLHVREACIDIAGKYRLPNTDMIRLGVKILAMNIDKMVKVEFD